MKSEGLTEGEDAAKLSNSMEEACTSESAFWKDNKKTNDIVGPLKAKREEKNMCFPNDVALKKKKINKYWFVPGSVGERNKIMKDMASVEEAIAKGAEKVV